MRLNRLKLLWLDILLVLNIKYQMCGEITYFVKKFSNKKKRYSIWINVHGCVFRRQHFTSTKHLLESFPIQLRDVVEIKNELGITKLYSVLVKDTINNYYIFSISYNSGNVTADDFGDIKNGDMLKIWKEFKKQISSNPAGL